MRLSGTCQVAFSIAVLPGQASAATCPAPSSSAKLSGSASPRVLRQMQVNVFLSLRPHLSDFRARPSHHLRESLGFKTFRPLGAGVEVRGVVFRLWGLRFKGTSHAVRHEHVEGKPPPRTSLLVNGFRV